MITIRFVSHPGIFDSLCKIAQYCYWPSHVEAILHDGRCLGSWFKQGGVRIRPANYDAGSFSKELFVSIKSTPDQEARFFAFLFDQVGKPYDAIAIISFYSGRDWQEDDSWECTELLAAGLVKCGILPENMAVKFSHLTPRDLILITSTIVI
jgi:uncharacterized protein YycO